MIVVLLLILESIGTSELILIGIIALIFLGPRKLPQIARTIGKTMADFRNTTNEFKATWQREVDFEEEVRALRTGDLDEPSTVPRQAPIPDDNANTIAPPEIKPVQNDLFTDLPSKVDPTETAPAEPAVDQPESAVDDTLSNKQSWL